jgi:hypothetical protein
LPDAYQYDLHKVTGVRILCLYSVLEYPKKVLKIVSEVGFAMYVESSSEEIDYNSVGVNQKTGTNIQDTFDWAK